MAREQVTSLEKCGCISKVNCQPVEKKNYEQSRMFHRGTQKGGRNSQYTVQVMEKENRKLYARVNNLHQNKRLYIKNLEDDQGSIATYTNNQEEG